MDPWHWCYGFHGSMVQILLILWGGSTIAIDSMGRQYRYYWTHALVAQILLIPRIGGTDTWNPKGRWHSCTWRSASGLAIGNYSYKLFIIWHHYHIQFAARLVPKTAISPILCTKKFPNHKFYDKTPTRKNPRSPPPSPQKKLNIQLKSIFDILEWSHRQIDRKIEMELMQAFQSFEAIVKPWNETKLDISAPKIKLRKSTRKPVR